MDGILRRLRINELKAQIALYKLEQTALIRELRMAGAPQRRRIEIHQMGVRLRFELRQAVNDLKWFEAEERLRRPDKAGQVKAMIQ